MVEMFDANRIFTAETDTKLAAYYLNDTIRSHLYTILVSMTQAKKHMNPQESKKNNDRSGFCFIFPRKYARLLSLNLEISRGGQYLNTY